MMFLASIGRVKHKRERDTITAEPTPRSPCPSKKSESSATTPLFVRGHAKESPSARTYSSLINAKTPTTADVRAQTSREPCPETVSSPGSRKGEKKSAGHCCHCAETPSSEWQPPRSVPYLDRLDCAEAQAPPTEGLSHPRSAGLGCRPRPGDSSHRSAQSQTHNSHPPTPKRTHRAGEGGAVPRYIRPVMAGGTGDINGGGDGQSITRNRPASARSFGAIRKHGLLKMKEPGGGLSKGCFGKSIGGGMPATKGETNCHQSCDEGPVPAAAANGGHPQPSQGCRRQQTRSCLGTTDVYRCSSDVKRHSTKGGRNRNGRNSAAARKPNNSAEVNMRIIIDSDSHRACKDHPSTDTQAWGAHTKASTGARAAEPDGDRVRGVSVSSTARRGLPLSVAGKNSILKAVRRAQGVAVGRERRPRERPSSAPPGQRRQTDGCLGIKKESGDGGGGSYDYDGGGGCGGGGGGGGGGSGGGGGAGGGVRVGDCSGAGGGDGDGGGGAVGTRSLTRKHCRERARAADLRRQGNWNGSGREERGGGLHSPEMPEKFRGRERPADEERLPLPLGRQPAAGGGEEKNDTRAPSERTSSCSRHSVCGRGSAGRSSAACTSSAKGSCCFAGNGSSASRRSDLPRTPNGSDSLSRGGGVEAEERRARLRVELETIRRRLHDTEGLLQKVDNSLQARCRPRTATPHVRTRREAITMDGMDGIDSTDRSTRSRFPTKAGSNSSVAASAGTASARYTAGDGVPAAGEHPVSPLVVTHSAKDFLDQL